MHRTFSWNIRKSLILGLFLFSAQFSFSQSYKNYFAVIATNIDSSILWYTETFELETIDFNKYPDRGFAQANLKNDWLHVELIYLENAVRLEELAKKIGPTPRITGLFKVGFSVPDFNQWLIKIKEQNIFTKGSVVDDPVSGKRTILLLDPDGNRIQLFEE